MNTVGASWLAFVPLLALVLYILAMLGVLWLAVRVVRHAWYWQSRSERSGTDLESSFPSSSLTFIAG